jgi:hypothetical protein
MRSAGAQGRGGMHLSSVCLIESISSGDMLYVHTLHKREPREVSTLTMRLVTTMAVWPQARAGGGHIRRQAKRGACSGDGAAGG